MEIMGRQGLNVAANSGHRGRDCHGYLPDMAEHGWDTDGWSGLPSAWRAAPLLGFISKWREPRRRESQVPGKHC